MVREKGGGLSLSPSLCELESLGTPLPAHSPDPPWLMRLLGRGY